MHRSIGDDAFDLHTEFDDVMPFSQSIPDLALDTSTEQALFSAFPQRQGSRASSEAMEIAFQCSQSVVHFKFLVLPENLPEQESFIHVQESRS